jgi:hypothetical protein
MLFKLISCSFKVDGAHSQQSLFDSVFAVPHLSPIERALSFINDTCKVYGFDSYASRTRNFDDFTKFQKKEIFSSMIVLSLIGDVLDQDVAMSLIRLLSTEHIHGTFNFFKDKFDGAFSGDVNSSSIGASALSKMQPVLNIMESTEELKTINSADMFEITDKIIANTISENDHVDQGVIEVSFPPRGSREGWVDPSVCANSLYLIALNRRVYQAQKTIDFIYNVLESGDYLNGTRYYPSPDSFLYFLSKACSESTELMGRFKPLLLEKVAERFGTTQNTLDLSMRILVCKNLGEVNYSDRAALSSLQLGSGAFPKDSFFRYSETVGYLGSESISTAFAIAALKS